MNTSKSFSQMTTREFAEVLASDAPAPGGGSTSALIGALAASLTKMVGELSGKVDDGNRIEEIKEEAGRLIENLFIAADKDTEAFMLVSHAFGMPKETDEEKALRSAAIQSGLKACTESPIDVMEKSIKVLDLISRLETGYNTNAASDLGVAVLSVQTALKGAWLNVLINVSSLKDKEIAAKFKARGEEILEYGEKTTNLLYQRILDTIQA